MIVANLLRQILEVKRRDRLTEPARFQPFCAEFHREFNRLRTEKNAALDTQRAELTRVERRIGELVEIITKDDAPVKALKDELKMLEARQAELASALAVTTAPSPLIHPDPALHEALRDPRA